MVLISHIKKFIYIKNCKVAGTSVEAYFEKYCLDPSIPHITQHKLDSTISEYGITGNRESGKITQYYNHMSASEIKNYIGENIFTDYLKFCVVRNPYDKMVSLYNMKVNRDSQKISFEQFCEESNCNNYQRYFINGKSCIDYYIRFENLQEDLQEVCRRLNIEHDITRLARYKTEFRKDNDYRPYYSEKTKQIVYDKHKEEFEMYNYTF